MRIAGLICAAAISIFAAHGAMAFDASAPETPGGSPTAAPRTPPADAGARSARSIECSQKADARDLHGKPSNRFMHDCKRSG